MKPEMWVRRATLSKQTPPQTGRKGTTLSLDSRNACTDTEAGKLSLMVSTFLNNMCHSGKGSAKKRFLNLTELIRQGRGGRQQRKYRVK